MSTASTKSSKKKKSEEIWGALKAGKTADPAPPGSEVSDRAWLIASVLILVVAGLLRLYNLELVPLHHDEGVNGNFLLQLVRNGFYHYDPENYHGPTLYYFAAVIPWTVKLFFGADAQNKYGLTTFNIRLVTALFGLATIWLVLLLRRRLGTVGSLAAAALLAVSPGAVYLSRYFIHESLFVFFTLGIVVAGLKYYEEGNTVYLILTAISAALLFATKETWIISVAVLIIALISTHAWRWLTGNVAIGREQYAKKGRVSNAKTLAEWADETIGRFGGIGNFAFSLAAAVAAFVVVGVLFYSSFMTNWKGVSDSLTTFAIWTKTGKTAHVHDSWTYVGKWLVSQESPLLALGAVGAALAVWKPKNSFALFAGLWAFGIIAAYSYVPYKTPWLMLNFVVPLAISGGYAIEWIYQELGKWEVEERVRYLSIAVVLIVAAGILPGSVYAFQKKPLVLQAMIPGYQTIDLNFLNYDNDDQYYVYVYAHTRRETSLLVDEINGIANRSGTKSETGITIVSPDYWPLPWYFRDYTRVGYYGHMSASTEPIIIANESQRAEMQATFGSRYRQVESGVNSNGSFALRPGVDLLLYVRRDVAAR